LLALDGSAGCAALVSMARGMCGSLGRLVSDAQRLRVGVALAVGGDTPAQLIDRAEQTLRDCEGHEPVSLSFADPEMRDEIEQRTFAAEELAQAIAARRIEPFYQPFVELGSGRVLGFEVLARWRDEQGRVRMPGEFLPLAEESGLVGPMFDALLEAAACEAANWPDEWNLALNLSAQQLGDVELVSRMVGSLRAAGIGPERLEIEIAERAIESDIVAARKLVAELREQRISVVLDNFGSGNLHLRELASIPFDRIKVDPAAIEDRNGSDAGTALGLIAAAANHLGVPVLLQGIETHAGAAAAQVQGCAVGQGYLFGRPDPQTRFFRLEGALARGSGKAA
jgi:EAL domain-containing protein (putative c-di-GMP-specific phosphodiesterase class I)